MVPTPEQNHDGDGDNDGRNDDPKTLSHIGEKTLPGNWGPGPRRRRA
jgi:hypothetical protein